MKVSLARIFGVNSSAGERQDLSYFPAEAWTQEAT
jgi:hypothetical protein